MRVRSSLFMADLLGSGTGTLALTTTLVIAAVAGSANHKPLDRLGWWRRRSLSHPSSSVKDSLAR